MLYYSMVIQTSLQDVDCCETHNPATELAGYYQLSFEGHGNH